MVEAFPREIQQFVHDEIARGHYRNEQDLLVEAVRYLRESGIRLEGLRQEVQRRLARLDRDGGFDLADDQALEAFLDSVENEVQQEASREKS